MWGCFHPYFRYEPSSDDEDAHHKQQSSSDAFGHVPGIQSVRVKNRSTHVYERSTYEPSPSFLIKVDSPLNVQLLERVVKTFIFVIGPVLLLRTNKNRTSFPFISRPSPNSRVTRFSSSTYIVPTDELVHVFPPPLYQWVNSRVVNAFY